MKIVNKSKCPFQHSFMDAKHQLKIVEIQPGEVKEVEDKIAQIWLKTGKVVEYVEPKEAKEKENELLAQIEKLKAENAKLKEAKKTKKK